MNSEYSREVVAFEILSHARRATIFRTPVAALKITLQGYSGRHLKWQF